jgi:hypothetical protein
MEVSGHFQDLAVLLLERALLDGRMDGYKNEECNPVILV